MPDLTSTMVSRLKHSLSWPCSTDSNAQNFSDEDAALEEYILYILFAIGVEVSMGLEDDRC